MLPNDICRCVCAAPCDLKAKCLRANYASAEMVGRIGEPKPYAPYADFSMELFNGTGCQNFIKKEPRHDQ